MKVFLALGCLVAAAVAHPDYSESWGEFKERFGKTYDNAVEEATRSSYWLANVRLIKSHNADADNGVHSFHIGENPLADMTTDEIRAQFNGFTAGDSQGAEFQSDVDMASLPTSIDWRVNKTVTPVKNQLVCGSCWAFSATGSLEGQHALKTGNLTSLSEQNLVDCATKEGAHGCHGGLMDIAFKYVKDAGGIDTEASYPYTAKDGNCTYDPKNSGATLTSWVDIAHNSEADLQKAVGTIGPISVAIDASRPTFHFYKRGVYHDRRCSSERLDHGVLAVGYGTTTNEDGKKPKDFWLVKNSWGEKWGMDGYIQMARNKANACGIATQASYPVV